MENKKNEIFAERNSPSDEELICVSVVVARGEKVKPGSVVFEIEGAKAIYEVMSEHEGYFYPTIKEGERFLVGQSIGYISVDEAMELNEVEENEIAPSSNSLTKVSNNVRNISKPALKYLEQLDDRDNVLKLLDGFSGLITIEVIKGILENPDSSEVLMDTSEAIFWQDFLSKSTNLEKCVFIGGGRGAVQTMDLIRKIGFYTPIGFMSDKEVNYIDPIGIPNLGAPTKSNILRIKSSGRSTNFVLTVGSSPLFRKMILDLLSDLNIKLISLIHPTVTLGANVEIGDGTLVFGNVHIGTGTSIGRGCFISSNSTIEHHNKIGDAFCCGPNFNTSGGVSIGSVVRCGLNVGVEPDLHIGDGCLIASGSILTRNLPSNTTLKTRM